MELVNQKEQPSVFDKRDIQSLLIDIENNRKITGPPAQQASVFDKRDIQSLLLDIEKNRKITGTPMQPSMEDAADPAIFQDLLNKVQDRPNG